MLKYENKEKNLLKGEKKMLVITARLFKDGQLVGYRLTDGNQVQDFTKQQTWMYAKNKQIMNVIASGTVEEPSLSGTNGFKLKDLPEVKYQQEQAIDKEKNIVKADASSVISSLLRYVLQNGVHTLPSDKKQLKDFGKKFLRSEYDRGIVHIENFRTNSAKIQILAGIKDESNPYGSVMIGTREEKLSDKDKLEYQTILNDFNTLTDHVSKLMSDTLMTVERLCRETASEFVDMTKVKQIISKHPSMNAIRNTNNKYTEHNELISEVGKFFKHYTAENSSQPHIDEVKKDINTIMDIIKEVKDYFNTKKMPETKTVQGLVSTGAVIGYVVKNIGNQPIAINRFLKNTTNKDKTVILNPGDRISLSRLELAMLSATPEISGEFVNGKVVCNYTTKKRSNIIELLNGHYFCDSTDELLKYVDIHKVASNQDIEKYFHLPLPARKEKAV